MGQESIHCIFCGKESKDVAWFEEGFTGRRCDCGLLYVSPRPSPEEILNWYDSDEADGRARSRVKSQFGGRLTSRHRLKLLKKYISRGSLLEIGPGGGHFLVAARSAGFKVFGIELNGYQARFISERLGIPVETVPLTQSSFDGALFDLICHFDVISHFYDPISEFIKFNRKLREGGILFFETGNGGDLSPRWLKFIGQLQYPQHLFLFSHKNIEELCRRTGFKVIGVRRCSILFHLTAIRLLGRFRRYLTGGYGENLKAEVAQNPEMETGKDSRGKDLVLKILILGGHFIRYRIGRLLPKGPQTVFYIARKISTP